MIIVARVGIGSFRSPVRSGREELIGARGAVTDWQGGKGHVFVHSERWNASGPQTLKKGQSIVVEAIDGLCLTVSAASDGNQS
jgi:membrane-bound serine protease (ClpP class)